jgi:hypothetical protein
MDAIRVDHRNETEQTTVGDDIASICKQAMELKLENRMMRRQLLKK